LELKDEGLGCTFWRSLFGRGLSVRLPDDDDDDDDDYDIRRRKKEVNRDCRNI
jgi:hypothetical protein